MARQAILKWNRLIAVAGVLATGCVDFVDVTHAGPSEPARLTVNIYFFEDTLLCGGSCRYPDGTRVQASPGGGAAWAVATLDPGTDAGGRRRRITDSTLVVSGFHVPVVDAEPFEPVTFRRSLPVVMDSLHDIGVTVQPPMIEDVVGMPPSFSWRLPTSTDADTVNVGVGEELVLGLVIPDPELAPPPPFLNWSLQLSGRSSIFITSLGAPPRQLRVPSYYIPDPTDGAVLARLDIFVGETFIPEPADMITRVLVHIALGWVVDVEQPGQD